MAVHVDELFARIADHQQSMLRAFQTHEWGRCKELCAEFRAWCEEHLGDAVTFEEE